MPLRQQTSRSPFGGPEDRPLAAPEVANLGRTPYRWMRNALLALPRLLPVSFGFLGAPRFSSRGHLFSRHPVVEVDGLESSFCEAAEHRTTAWSWEIFMYRACVQCRITG